MRKSDGINRAKVASTESQTLSLYSLLSDLRLPLQTSSKICVEQEGLETSRPLTLDANKQKHQQASKQVICFALARLARSRFTAVRA